MLETSQNVVWQSADEKSQLQRGRRLMKRPTAQHGGARMECNGDSLSLPLSLSLSLSYSFIYVLDSQPTVAWPPTTVAVTVQWLFSKKFQIAWNVQKTLSDQSATDRVTSDHCRVTVQWLFSKKFQIAWNVQKRCLTVGRRSRDLRPLSRDCSVTFFKKFQIAWNVQKRCLTVGRRSRDLRPLSCDRSVTFFKNVSNCLKRPKNVVWQSATDRVTSDHCRVTVQWLFSKKFQIAWNVQKTLFDSRPTVAWPPTTVAWPFSDFFQKFSKSLETSKKRCLTVAWRSRDLRPLSRDRWATAPHTLAYVVFLVFILLLSFRRTACSRISSYRNGPILEISTSFQS